MSRDASRQPATLGDVRPCEGADRAGCSARQDAPKAEPLTARSMRGPPPLDAGDRARRRRPLYEARRKIYPQRVARHVSAASNGPCCCVTLGIYYLLPFVRWDRGPNAPDQAVLVDFPDRPLLFLLHRDLAAGSLLPHRPADPGRDGAVPDERGRRAGCGAAISARRRSGPICSRRSSAGSRATAASTCSAIAAAMDRRARRTRRHSSTSSG